ncbi:(2Fe-2S)-binding protein [Dyadobacter psychrotolerans]|uniref:(2Fe-2S)-binding protein n=2 Tax=Dyadobacter psychrotolerans TaxID=2541721 RepID=A0A4R5DSV3_9BACT|nr:(2Fe-2S)-binding protein [Dyadobacter psychrotolerans]
MKRGQFIKSLGLSTSALMAFYCLGVTMTSCGTSEEDPDPTPGGGTGTGITGTTTGSSINFTIDLTNASYSSLKTAGQFKVIGDVLVAFTSGNTYAALAKACTHEGTTLQYRSANNDLYCSNHLSEFSTNGAVEKGPVTGGTISALKAYKVSLSTDGNTLTVTA